MTCLCCLIKSFLPRSRSFRFGQALRKEYATSSYEDGERELVRTTYPERPGRIRASLESYSVLALGAYKMLAGSGAGRIHRSYGHSTWEKGPFPAPYSPNSME